MLESMIEHSRPTRAETTDVFNAIMDETDAVMLSGETAAGKYPLGAVKYMASIAEEAEKLAGTEDTWTKILPDVENSVEEIVAHSACTAAVNVGAKAIVAYTNTGGTARFISKYHPPVPVVALTPNEHVCRQLSLSWGVTSLTTPCFIKTATMLEQTEVILKGAGIVETGDTIVIVAGIPLGTMHSSNIMKLQIIA
jgi:pyruvate kinase